MQELFKIYKLTATEASQIDRERNLPHLHNFEELIIGTQGAMEHFIDFKSEVLAAPFVSFVSQGKTHRFQPILVEGQCEIWVLRFRSEFIPETIFQLYAHYQQRSNIDFQADACFYRLTQLCEMISGEMSQENIDYAVVRQLLSTLFILIESERKKRFPEELQFQKTQSVTFKNFLTILEDNFRRTEGVNFYAEKLFMSARNLNFICQQIMQQSVSEIIETRKLIEAKNLLMNTERSIAEIGFDIGYQDKAYFASVFKKKSGQTPSDFREEMKRLL